MLRRKNCPARIAPARCSACRSRCSSPARTSIRPIAAPPRACTPTMAAARKRSSTSPPRATSCSIPAPTRTRKGSPLVHAACIGRGFAGQNRAELDRAECAQTRLPAVVVHRRLVAFGAALGPLDRVVVGRSLQRDQERGLAVPGRAAVDAAAADHGDETFEAAERGGAKRPCRKAVGAGGFETACDRARELLRR